MFVGCLDIYLILLLDDSDDSLRRGFCSFLLLLRVKEEVTVYMILERKRKVGHTVLFLTCG